MSTTYALKTGDVVFVHTKDFLSRIIQLGQWVRYRRTPGKPWYWNHVALVVNPFQGDLVEAAPQGVRAVKGGIRDIQVGCLVPMELTIEQQINILGYLSEEIQRGARYGWWQVVSNAIRLATNSRLGSTADGTHTCSGLVGEALERAGYNFGLDAEQLTPADLASYFEVGR